MSASIQSVSELVSLIASLIAFVSTFYFWLVRSNGERGNLEVHPVSRLQGTVMMAMEDVTTYRRLSPGDGEVVMKYWLHVTIVNNSTLPNAILGGTVSIRLADGSWQMMDLAAAEPEVDLFPTNIDPLTTVSWKLALSFVGRGTISGGFRERAIAAGDALPDTIAVRMTLHGLKRQSFHCQFTDDGSGLSRTSADDTGRMAA